jgi:hypothetical protein
MIWALDMGIDMAPTYGIGPYSTAGPAMFIEGMPPPALWLLDETTDA